MLAAGALCVACSAGGVPARLPIAGTRGTGALATVVHVVDGDTLDVRVGGQVERVRLLGVDTPETVKPGHAGRVLRPRGVEAHQAAAARRAPPCCSSATARHGIATPACSSTCWRRADGLFVNRSLLAGGFAAAVVDQPEHRAPGRAGGGRRRRPTGRTEACGARARRAVHPDLVSVRPGRR